MSNTDFQSSDEKRSIKKTGLGRGLGSLLGENNKSGFDGSGIELPESNISDDQISKLKETFAKNDSRQEVKQEIPPSQLSKGLVQQAVQPQVPDHKRIWTISIDKIKPNSNQPRKSFDLEKLKELSQSIREQGILQPIVARRKSDKNFEIIAGERRWRAAQLAGLHEVPVILKETTEQKALELALIENIQRHDLNPIEEAEAYQFLMEEYGLTQQRLAEKVGKERATVANVLRLLNLTSEVRSLVVDGELSLGHAKVLLSVVDPVEQRKWAQWVIKREISVRELEKGIKKGAFSEGEMSPVEKLDISRELVKGLSEELRKMLGTKVSIGYNQGKGKLAIHFYSDQELNSIVEKMRKACQK